MSFVKQVYNYIFVATDQQNVLLKINGIGVGIGILIGIFTIPAASYSLGRGLRGATLTQLIMELLFMVGAIRVGYRKKISPIINTKVFQTNILILIGFSLVGYAVTHMMTIGYVSFFVVAGLLNGALILVSLPTLKKI